jgi:hypothetical protein
LLIIILKQFDISNPDDQSLATSGNKAHMNGGSVVGVLNESDHLPTNGMSCPRSISDLEAVTLEQFGDP